jgi:hypothetical protein
MYCGKPEGQPAFASKKRTDKIWKTRKRKLEASCDGSTLLTGFSALTSERHDEPAAVSLRGLGIFYENRSAASTEFNGIERAAANSC